MANHWSLDPDITYLNHGTVGAPPRRVLAAQQAIRAAIEKQPSRVELPDPSGGPGAFIESIVQAIGPRTRLAVLDHITSESALVLPITEMIVRCHNKGVAVLIDGAHAPGMLPLDLPTIGADWYVGNLHKWAFAPRSCGFLWAAPGLQENLHPTVIS